MKNAFLITIALFYSLFTFAQPGVSIDEVNKTIVGGTTERNVYKMLIHQAKKQDVLKGLKKRLEKGTKTKVIVDKSNVLIERVVYKDYWSDSLVLNVEVVEVELGTVCFFAIDLDTVAISSVTHPELNVKVKRYMKSFGLDMYDQAVNEEMEREEKHLKSIEKDLKSALHENDKITQKIHNEKMSINDLSDEVSMNEADRGSKIAEIQVQKDRVNESNDIEKDAEKEKLKVLKVDLKKIKKTNKKLNKEIFKKENNIRDMEIDIEKNVQLQESVHNRMTEQNAVVEEVRKKQFAISDAKKSMD
ncbi:MAG: hypothetical protein ACPGEG_05075 [Salibacteraceae bacterium]